MIFLNIINNNFSILSLFIAKTDNMENIVRIERIKHFILLKEKLNENIDTNFSSIREYV